MNEPLADDMRATHNMAFCFAGSPADYPIDTILWLNEYEIPKDKEAIIAQHHNEMVGHHGVDRTMKEFVEMARTAHRRPHGNI